MCTVQALGDPVYLELIFIYVDTYGTHIVMWHAKVEEGCLFNDNV